MEDTKAMIEKLEILDKHAKKFYNFKDWKVMKELSTVDKIEGFEWERLVEFTITKCQEYCKQTRLTAKEAHDFTDVVKNATTTHIIEKIKGHIKELEKDKQLVKHNVQAKESWKQGFNYASNSQITKLKALLTEVENGE